jgi:serine O-acetyltransferase
MRFAFATSIPYTAAIGDNTYFNNWGMGIVIHRRVVIGKNCRVGHGVTIGGRSEHHEVPVIGNDVLIGVGATILGPVKVGDHATVGAHSVVIDDVPPYAVVVGAPARVVKYTDKNSTGTQAA